MKVLVIYCCRTNYPNTSQLRAVHTSSCSFCGPGTGCLWSRSAIELQLGCQPGLQSHLKAFLAQDRFQDRWRGWQALSHGPLHRIASLHAAIFPQGQHSDRGQAPRGSPSLYICIPEATSHHVWNILFLTSESVGPSPSQGEATAQRLDWVPVGGAPWVRLWSYLPHRYVLLP